MLVVVLTSVSVVSSSVAVWAHQVLFDTNRFMETVEPVLDDPDFYILIGDRVSSSVIEALAIEDRVGSALEDLDVYLSDALLDAIDVGERERERLRDLNRPSLAALAPSIAAGLETGIEDGIHAFFSSEAFVTRFPELVGRSHEAAVALARGQLAELPNVYLEIGEVRLNLIPFVGEALHEVAEEIRAVLPDFELPSVVSGRLDEGREQLEAALQANLPEDFGQITVMSESVLSEVQDIATQLDRNAWAAVLLSLAFLVTALAVSSNRRETAVHLGIGVFVAVVVAAVAVRQLEGAVVAQIVDPRGSALAGDVVKDVLSGLRTIELMIALAGILVAVVAYLAGRPEWFVRSTAAFGEWTDSATSASGLDRWILDHAGLLQTVGVLIAAAALFVVGLDLLSIIVIGLLLAGYLWAVSAVTHRARLTAGNQDARAHDEP